MKWMTLLKFSLIHSCPQAHSTSSWAWPKSRQNLFVLSYIDARLTSHQCRRLTVEDLTQSAGWTPNCFEDCTWFDYIGAKWLPYYHLIDVTRYCKIYKLNWYIISYVVCCMQSMSCILIEAWLSIPCCDVSLSIQVCQVIHLQLLPLDMLHPAPFTNGHVPCSPLPAKGVKDRQSFGPSADQRRALGPWDIPRLTPLRSWSRMDGSSLWTPARVASLVWRTLEEKSIQN